MINVNICREHVTTVDDFDDFQLPDMSLSFDLGCSLMDEVMGAISKTDSVPAVNSQPINSQVIGHHSTATEPVPAFDSGTDSDDRRRESSLYQSSSSTSLQDTLDGAAIIDRSTDFKGIHDPENLPVTSVTPPTSPWSRRLDAAKPTYDLDLCSRENTNYVPSECTTTNSSSSSAMFQNVSKVISRERPTERPPEPLTSLQSSAGVYQNVSKSSSCERPTERPPEPLSQVNLPVITSNARVESKNGIVTEIRRKSSDDILLDRVSVHETGRRNSSRVNGRQINTNIRAPQGIPTINLKPKMTESAEEMDVNPLRRLRESQTIVGRAKRVFKSSSVTNDRSNENIHRPNLNANAMFFAKLKEQENSNDDNQYDDDDDDDDIVHC